MTIAPPHRLAATLSEGCGSQRISSYTINEIWSPHSLALAGGHVRPRYKSLPVLSVSLSSGSVMATNTRVVYRETVAPYVVSDIVTFTILSTCANSWNFDMNKYEKYSIITHYLLFSNLWKKKHHEKFREYRNNESYDTVLTIFIHIYIPAVGTSRKNEWK